MAAISTHGRTVAQHEVPRAELRVATRRRGIAPAARPVPKLVAHPAVPGAVLAVGDVR
jgi:hypothetical protein